MLIRLQLLYSFPIIGLMNLYAQNNYHFKYIASDDGLSLNDVTRIIQDTKGFLWFGTGNGLNKFDGYKFITYTNEFGNPNSLSNNYISALHEDSEGNIWIGTIDGLKQFDEKKRQSLDLQLVETLVFQLEGTLEIKSEPGTSYKMKFKLK